MPAEMFAMHCNLSLCNNYQFWPLLKKIYPYMQWEFELDPWFQLQEHDLYFGIKIFKLFFCSEEI